MPEGARCTRGGIALAAIFLLCHSPQGLAQAKAVVPAPALPPPGGTGVAVTLHVAVDLGALHPAVSSAALECGAVPQTRDWVSAHLPMLTDYDATARWVLGPAHYAGQYAVIEFPVSGRGYAGSQTFTTTIPPRGLLDPATHAPFAPGPAVLVACWLRLNGRPALLDAAPGLQVINSSNFTGVSALPLATASADAAAAGGLTAQLTARGNYMVPAAVTINFGAASGAGMVAASGTRASVGAGGVLAGGANASGAGAGGATAGGVTAGGLTAGVAAPPLTGTSRFAGTGVPQLTTAAPGASGATVAPALGTPPPAAGIQAPPPVATAPPPKNSVAVTPVPAITGLTVAAQTPVYYVVSWQCASGELPCSQPGTDEYGNPVVDGTLRPTYAYDLAIKAPGTSAFAPAPANTKATVQFSCPNQQPESSCPGWATALTFPYGSWVAAQTVFRVTRSDPTGAHTGAHADFTVTAPAQPQEPTGFTATEPQFGQVVLAWQAVPNAVGYRISEKGSTAPPASVTGTTMTLNTVTAGPHTYQVATTYSSSVPNPTLPEASVTVHVVPPANRSVPWLSKSAGSGNPVASLAHITANNVRAGDTLQGLATSTGFMTGWQNNGYAPTAAFASVPLLARYANVTELGFKRQVICWQWPNRVGPVTVGFVTACTAGNHGSVPGPQPADPAAIASLASMPESLGVIVTSPTGGQLFANLVPDTQSYSGVVDPAAFQDVNWGLGWKVVLSTTLDSEGAKYVPNACLACHGGSFNAATGKVTGASLLPVDPNLVAFPNVAGQDRTAYEEEVRAINAAIAKSGAAAAVVNYINGLYGGAVDTPGTKALANYVPPAWSQQAQLFQAVVRPNCLNCHLATPQSVSFDSAARFMQNKAAIYSDVCVAHSMPHAQLPYQNFWTSTGSLGSTSVNLAGFMLGILGYTSCP